MTDSEEDSKTNEENNESEDQSDSSVHLQDEPKDTSDKLLDLSKNIAQVTANEETAFEFECQLMKGNCNKELGLTLDFPGPLMQVAEVKYGDNAVNAWNSAASPETSIQVNDLITEVNQSTGVNAMLSKIKSEDQLQMKICRPTATWCR